MEIGLRAIFRSMLIVAIVGGSWLPNCVLAPNIVSVTQARSTAPALMSLGQPVQVATCKCCMCMHGAHGAECKRGMPCCMGGMLKCSTVCSCGCVTSVPRSPSPQALRLPALVPIVKAKNSIQSGRHLFSHVFPPETPFCVINRLIRPDLPPPNLSSPSINCQSYRL